MCVCLVVCQAVFGLPSDFYVFTFRSTAVLREQLFEDNLAERVSKVYLLFTCLAT